MSLKSALLSEYTSLKSSDREGLFYFFENFVKNTRKKSGLTVEDVTSLVLRYTPKLQSLAQSVECHLEEGTFKIVPGTRDLPTYKELKYGSLWFEGSPKIDDVIIQKIFWGART